MSCATTDVLGSLMFERDDVNRASLSMAVCDEEQLVADAMAKFLLARNQRRGVVVQLVARRFTDTAAHFLRVTTPVDWPADEATD
ncbi:MAG: hypothetical protein WBD87_08675 [Candidatus Acidiferrales bacterium]